MSLAGMSTNGRMELHQRYTKVAVMAGSRVAAGYLSMIYEQGQKQAPLTDEEAKEAYKAGTARIAQLSQEYYKVDD